MKKLAVSIVLALFFIVVSAQNPYLPDGITFGTQEQIDSFQVNYPGCSEIEGGVLIGGSVWGNDINNLNALEVLTSTGGLTITFTHIINFNGLENLTSINGGLILFANPDLSSFNGLAQLIFIEDDLIIGASYFSGGAFPNLDALQNLTYIGGNISIRNNESLTSLWGLNNIDAGSVENITIFSNSNLSECHIQSICNYLVAPNGTVNIEDNAAGCNSPEEVIEACEAVGIDEYNVSSITIHPNPTDNGSITITLDNPHNLHLTCFNTFGQQVHQQDLTSSKTKINVSTWTPCIYLAVVYEDGKPVGRAKFVVRY